ncbi:MAG: hypothetical protein HWE22_19215 [Flavobacteriales bacterium]|nr:hypothetical protein [Flavobacteriales bacterium]
MRLFYLLVLFLAFSCENSAVESSSISKNTQPVSDQAETAFQQLCTSLPIVELPFSMYCEDCCAHPDTSIQRKIQHYLPEGSSFMGIIEQNDDFISVLTTYPADWIIPAVVVYNSEGEKIDEEIFLGGYCGSDFGFMSRQYFYINTSRELLEIDSIFTLEIDPETFETIDTTKTEIKIKKFQINASGIQKQE